jgi:zinc transport system ATP-binding protein
MHDTQNYLIKAQNICLRIAAQTILDTVSLEVKAGEIVTLVGPNGSGKSSLVRLLLKLIQPDTGSVSHRPGLRIGYMPQKIHIDPVLPLSVKRFLHLAADVSQRQVVQVSEQVEVAALLDRPVQNISGGEFQRVLLARALLTKPDCLVLDEPAQGVDINGQQQLYQLIANIRDQLGCGVLMISHDLHLVMASTDQVLCLNTHICCQGHPDAVSKHPEYLKLFGSSLAGLAVYTHHHDHDHDLHGDVIERKVRDHNGCKHG